MPEQAHVTSVEALEAFKASLIVFLDKARPTLEEVKAEVLRTRVWLQSDRRPHWESEARRRRRKLEETQQTLFSARLSTLQDASADGKATLHKLRRAMEESEAKLKLLKVWNREFDSRVQPLLKQLDILSTLLSHQMPKAVTYLSQAANTLSSYSGTARQIPAPEKTHSDTPDMERRSERQGGSSVSNEETQ